MISVIIPVYNERKNIPDLIAQIFQVFENLKCECEIIFVDDIADACVFFMNKKTQETLINIGTGKGTSVLEVIHTFEKVNNLKLNYKIVGRRDGDVMSCYADTTIANKELNWKTEIGLDEALRSAWQWQQKQSV